ncbi:hypothetical protein J3A83DRAFT_4205414 [Scleroderma citrinum]
MFVFFYFWVCISTRRCCCMSSILCMSSFIIKCRANPLPVGIAYMRYIDTEQLCPSTRHNPPLLFDRHQHYVTSQEVWEVDGELGTSVDFWTSNKNYYSES